MEGRRNELGSLALTRRPGERVALLLDDRVVGYVALDDVMYGQLGVRVRLRFLLPQEYVILREELLEDDQR